jgi:hypothetical protein
LLHIQQCSSDECPQEVPPKFKIHGVAIRKTVFSYSLQRESQFSQFLFFELYMKHPRWCNDHKIYQYSQSQPTHALRANLLEGNCFDPRLVSSSGHDTGMWIYTETKHYKLEISTFYIKNVCKVYKSKFSYIKP